VYEEFEIRKYPSSRAAARIRVADFAVEDNMVSGISTSQELVHFQYLEIAISSARHFNLCHDRI